MIHPTLFDGLFSITWLQSLRNVVVFTDLTPMCIHYCFLEGFDQSSSPHPPAQDVAIFLMGPNYSCFGRHGPSGRCLCYHRQTWFILWAMFGMSYFLVTLVIESYRCMMPMLLANTKSFFKNHSLDNGCFGMCMIRDIFFNGTFQTCCRCGQGVLEHSKQFGK